MDLSRLLLFAVLTISLCIGGGCGADESDESDDSDAPGECRQATDADWTTGLDDLDAGALMSVWGPAPDQLWAVGGQPDDGIALQFDGNHWQDVDVGDGPMINWVHGVDGDTWMVGNDGRALRIRNGDVEHFDTGIDTDLWGVWAGSSDQVWTVGGDARDMDATPVVAKFDGDQFVEQPLPEMDRNANALFKVWGSSTDQVFAVGAMGLILEYDGDQWQQVPTGAGDDFVSLWGRSDDDIIAVGGRANGQIARYDGDQWTTELLPGVPGLNGVWMDCTGTAHASGVDGYSFRLPPDSFEPVVESTPTTDVLHGIFGFDDGPRIGVGGTLNSSPPYRGVIIESRDR